MVLSTLVYIAIIIIVIIIIVLALRFLFSAIFILPVTLEHDYPIKFVYAQEGAPLANTTNASSSVEDAKNMSVIEGTMNQTQ